MNNKHRNIYNDLVACWEPIKEELYRFKELINKELEKLPYGYINGAFEGFDEQGARFGFTTGWGTREFTHIPYSWLNSSNDEDVIWHARKRRKEIEEKEAEKRRIEEVVRKGKEAAKELKEKTHYLELKKKYGDTL